MRNARDHGFLWRISKDGHASYLFGTIHVARLDWMFPGPAVVQALRATDTMALELDMMDPDIVQRTVKALAEQRGAVLPAPLEQRMRLQMQNECIPEDKVKGLIPEMQLALLEMSLGRRDGIDPGFAIDAFLAGLAHGASMTVVSLETPEGQLGMLQMPQPEDTVVIVNRSLDQMENGHARALLNRTAKVWSEADYDAMTRYGEWCECLDTEAERKLMVRLLDERNPAMAERIDTLHAQGKQVFAAVGSLHMFGDTGLPGLMEKRGYRVERVDLKP